MQIIKAGLAYCLLTYLVGFALGPLRVFLVEPHLGPFLSTLLEAPLMLVAMTLVCLWCLSHFRLGEAITPRILMGALAFVVLMCFEFLGALILRGQGPSDHAAAYLTPQGLLSLTLFVFFAVLPVLLAKFRRRIRS